MKVLVTGGAGYIGSRATGILLSKRFNVRVLDNLTFGEEALQPYFGREGFEFLKGDIREKKTVAEALAGVEAVLHLAAIVGAPESSRRPDLAHEINYEASVQLIESSKDRGIKRFIFASTCSNYGLSDTSKYAVEEDELTPLSPYAKTKVAVEEYLIDSLANGFHPTVCRLATVFGPSPRMRFDLLLNELVADAVLKKVLAIRGATWRPFVHIDDVARAFVTVLNAPVEKVSGRVFNVGATSENYQKTALAELIKKYLPGIQIRVSAGKADPRDYKVSFDKLANELGFKIEKTVEAGIVELIDLLKRGTISDPYSDEYSNLNKYEIMK